MNEKDKLLRFKITKSILLFWTIFVGIGALAGSIGMFVDISGKTLGMDAMLPYFQVLPFSEYLFQDFLFPGISLLIVNGISNIIASILIIAKKKIGYILGGIFGFTLMCWIIIQFVILPPNVLSILYFIFGILQLIAGIETYIYNKQCQFKFKTEDYTNISKDSTTLVIYYSRTGYSKKIAYEVANKIGAEIYEIRTKERTNRILGFLWCGRYGMHRWKMPIDKIELDFSKYNKIIIVSPLWVFHICAPIRTLFIDYSDDLKEKQIYLKLLHFNPFVFKCSFDEISRFNPSIDVKTYTSQNGIIKQDIR